MNELSDDNLATLVNTTSIGDYVTPYMLQAFEELQRRRASALPAVGDAERMRKATIEECAKVAERIWDQRKHGAHGGEQANRTAAAIRALKSTATGD